MESDENDRFLDTCSGAGMVLVLNNVFDYILIAVWRRLGAKGAVL